MRMNHKKVAITKLSFLIPSIIKFHKKNNKNQENRKMSVFVRKCVPPFYGPKSQCSLPWPMFPICSFFMVLYISVSSSFPIIHLGLFWEALFILPNCRLSWYVNLYFDKCKLALENAKQVQQLRVGLQQILATVFVPNLFQNCTLLFLNWLYLL